MDKLFIVLWIVLVSATVLTAQNNGAYVSLVNPVYGVSDAVITCEFIYNADDQYKSFVAHRKGVRTRTCLIDSDFVWQDANPPNTPDVRDSFSGFMSGGIARGFNWTISDTGCGDEGEYKCTYESNGFVIYSATQTMSLIVRPENPVMEWVTRQETTELVEGSNLEILCRADLGRPLGNIVWKVFSGQNPISVSSLIETTDATGNLLCTRTVTSTLTMGSLGKQHQDLSGFCFVREEGSTADPVECNPTSQRCQTFGPIQILYPVKTIEVSASTTTTQVYAGETVTLTCQADAVPQANYTWVMHGDENRTLVVSEEGGVSTLELVNLDIDRDSGVYNCTATNTVAGEVSSKQASITISVVLRPTTEEPTSPTSPTTEPTEPTNSPSTGGSSGDDNTIIIVCVVLAVVVAVAVAVGIFCFLKRRNRKEIEEPPEKPYNNRSNLAFQNSQPDLVADDKKFHNPSLNNSFDPKNEDGLMYADLTYDNRPRSRKPMAIGDTASEYSDVQMPSV